MLPDKRYFEEYAKKNNIPFNLRNLLLEYLQTRILRSLALSQFNDVISFLGGTALRFGHKINRFSEDLDFDLLKKDLFKPEELAKKIKSDLELFGFLIETRTKKTENIDIIYFKFSEILYDLGISPMKDEKVLVKFEIDFSPFKSIKKEALFVENFDEKFPILINTLDTIFAQKVVAFLFRPYQKGRDFYGLLWFFAQKNVEPNYAIFREKSLKITDKKSLEEEMKKALGKMDLKQASRDVEKFLFYPEEAKWILDFEKHLENYCRK